MQSRAEVTRQVREGVCEGQEDRQGPVLHEVVAVTVWSRDNARRRLNGGGEAATGQRPSG
jgi:hypothetical protein